MASLTNNLTTVSLNNWVFVGSGFLYGAPLFADALLFRLFDHATSVLVRHAACVSMKQELGKHGDLSMSLEYTKPLVIEFTLFDSVSAGIGESSHEPFQQIQIQSVIQERKLTNRLTIRFIPCMLDMKNSLIVFPFGDVERQYTIANTNKAIRGKIALGPMEGMPMSAIIRGTQIQLLDSQTGSLCDLTLNNNFGVSATCVSATRSEVISVSPQ